MDTKTVTLYIVLLIIWSSIVLWLIKEFQLNDTIGLPGIFFLFIVAPYGLYNILKTPSSTMLM